MGAGSAIYSGFNFDRHKKCTIPIYEYLYCLSRKVSSFFWVLGNTLLSSYKKIFFVQLVYTGFQKVTVCYKFTLKKKKKNWFTVKELRTFGMTYEDAKPVTMDPISTWFLSLVKNFFGGLELCVRFINSINYSLRIATLYKEIFLYRIYVIILT